MRGPEQRPFFDDATVRKVAIADLAAWRVPDPQLAAYLHAVCRSGVGNPDRLRHKFTADHSIARYTNVSATLLARTQWIVIASNFSGKQSVPFGCKRHG
jgi:hypothetical protein